MIKWVVVLCFLLGAGYAVSMTKYQSDEYWQSIGPRWDRMLNPCSYGKCE